MYRKTVNTNTKTATMENSTMLNLIVCNIVFADSQNACAPATPGINSMLKPRSLSISLFSATNASASLGSFSTKLYHSGDMKPSSNVKVTTSSPSIILYSLSPKQTCGGKTESGIYISVVAQGPPSTPTVFTKSNVPTISNSIT
jgi:hypothetical protein